MYVFGSHDKDHLTVRAQDVNVAKLRFALRGPAELDARLLNGWARQSMGAGDGFDCAKAAPDATSITRNAMSLMDLVVFSFI
jgi:hypothetical protein